METTTNTPDSQKTTRQKWNPARARRSRLRLEEFHRKKEEEKLKQQKTGCKATGRESSSSSSQLVVQLSKGENITVETCPHSPILQVDGQKTLTDGISFTFKSEYAEEDILYSLKEIFPPFMAQLNSRVRLGARAADH